jgi:uncharacterized damage-inducible protein DinB
MVQPDIGSVCRSHLEFMKWADEIMLAALLKVPADKVSVDMGNSFKSMLDTLNHVYLAEQVWFKRIEGENARLADLAVPPSPEALAQAWPELHQSWLSWADSLSAEDLAGPFTFRNNTGVETTIPYWQIVLHVVNHGSYHRGQFTTLLRQAAVTPPATDLFVYYRTH